MKLDRNRPRGVSEQQQVMSLMVKLKQYRVRMTVEKVMAVVRA